MVLVLWYGSKKFHIKMKLKYRPNTITSYRVENRGQPLGKSRGGSLDGTLFEYFGTPCRIATLIPLRRMQKIPS